MLANTNVLLIVTGGIAAEKVPELINILRNQDCKVRCILTHSGSKFISAEELTKLTGAPTYQEMFFTNKNEKMEHIYLSRESDLILVAPATANIIAKIANGIADDLASTTLLANDKPIFIAPSMNVMMWKNPATQINLKKVLSQGIVSIGPESGLLACGEIGEGRMCEPETIVNYIKNSFKDSGERKTLFGHKIVITSGPTQEPIDPVRYISNRSSGKQGNSIAGALSKFGAEVVLISGPTQEPYPEDVKIIEVETAEEMLQASISELPSSVFISVAAVSDWKAETIEHNKIKKNKTDKINLTLKRNPDILYSVSSIGSLRPSLVIGFSAETENVIKNSKIKLEEKACDWIVANDVSSGFGHNSNQVHIIRKNDIEAWPKLEKSEIARKLSQLIANFLEKKNNAT